MSQLPLPVRLLNAGGRTLNAVGLEPVNLEFDALLKKARGNTGLSDFGDTDFEAPLKMLLDGLENEAQLSTLGRTIARTDLLRTLENRLGLVDLLKRHPEIEEQPIEKPLFVVGPPRSGTTMLRLMFNAHPDAAPAQFYRRLRLEKARDLLLHTNLPTLEVACLSGFSSSSHFAMAYQRQYGVRPSEARRDRSMSTDRRV